MTNAFAERLRGVARPAMPRPVASELIADARRIVGVLIDDDIAAALMPKFLSELESGLWRCAGEESALAERLVDALEATARLRWL